MNAVELRRERCVSHRAAPQARKRCGASRSTREQRYKPLPIPPREKQVVIAPDGRSQRLWWVAFWFGIVVTLAALGFVIGTWLESGLLGFLGADIIFLVVASFFTGGQGSSHRGNA